MGEHLRSEGKDIELKVGAATSVESLAIAVVKNLDEGKKVALCCIGDKCVGVAVRSIVRANAILATKGVYLGTVPSMNEVVSSETLHNQTVTRFNIISGRLGSMLSSRL